MLAAAIGLLMHSLNSTSMLCTAKPLNNKPYLRQACCCNRPLAELAEQHINALPQLLLNHCARLLRAEGLYAVLQLAQLSKHRRRQYIRPEGSTNSSTGGASSTLSGECGVMLQLAQLSKHGRRQYIRPAGSTKGVGDTGSTVGGEHGVMLQLAQLSKHG
jgi:hypothetical protein